jgi:hypothetical protein
MKARTSTSPSDCLQQPGQWMIRNQDEFAWNLKTLEDDVTDASQAVALAG